jgi:hypothetical protein
MADEREQQPEAAPEGPREAEPQPRQPRALRLRAVSDGSDAWVEDAETGERLDLDAHTRLDVLHNPQGSSAARLVAVFVDLPVEHRGEGEARPYELHGFVVGSRSGPLPAGVGVPPPMALPAPAPQAAPAVAQAPAEGQQAAPPSRTRRLSQEEMDAFNRELTRNNPPPGS